MRRLWLFFLGKKANVRAFEAALEKAQPKDGLWNRIMTKHLLLFNTVSSGVLMFFGDVSAQFIEKKLGEKESEGYDYKRMARMATVGTLQGPMHHFYYTWVDKIMPKTDGKTVFYKILMDQFIASPAFIVSYFFPAGLLEGHSLKEVNEELLTKFLTVYKADWLYWPPVQFINFYFLPLRYRVLYINASTTVYNVFLCYIKHKNMKAESNATEKPI